MAEIKDKLITTESLKFVYDSLREDIESLKGQTGTSANYLAGDANGDGVVDENDALLIRQYLDGYDVEINLACADVDGNGIVTMDDAVRITRYLNGEDVELLPSPLAPARLPTVNENDNGKVLQVKDGKWSSEEMVAIPYQVKEISTTTVTIYPEIYYDFGTVESLAITLEEVDDGNVHEYCFEFVPSEGFGEINITPEPRWATTSQPLVGKVCQVSIVRGIGVMVSA